ncbi:beta strand repeat-containing protein [Mucilaginibacter sp. X4EP1]|uniref:beta strand repeat-containing protein n=1 Tax=Mucilaginibacter sp. X4EP1 TaxID=2723092 RepID=UPI0021690D95|nr:T9SS type A sorting domain-containing protein [Mucilaginibacter sp. X4EP1]
MTGNSTPTFSIDMPTGSALTPVLQLTNANAINSASVAGSMNFYNNTGGTGTCTVSYNGTGSQEVYTNTSTILSSSPQTYQNLVLTTSGAKTTDAGTLSVAANLTTSATAATPLTTVLFNSHNTVVTVGGNWTNSCSTTQGSGNITVAGSISNNSGGTINLGSGNLSIATNYTNNSGGIYTQSTGTTIFNGSAAQTLVDNSTAGTTFNNVTFNGTSASSISTINAGTGNFAISTTGVLTMANNATLIAGTTTAGGAAYLTLLSNANSSAAVANIPSTCIIKGNVNVQRFITGTNSNYVSYRLLSSPVNTVSPTSAAGNYISLYNLNRSITAGGITYNGVYTGGPGGTAGGFNIRTNNPIIYLYNETLKTSNTAFTSGKNVGISAIDITSSAATDVTTVSTATTVGGVAYSGASGINIPAGNGYIDYFVGPNTISTPSGPISNAVITNVGFINQQNVQVYLWYTPGNGTGTGSAGQLSYSTPASGPADTYQGYNMVGNPYPSTLSLLSVFSDNGGIGSIYVLSNYNPGGQEYNAYTSVGASSSPSPAYIVSGQGFLAKVTGGAKTLIFKESEKAPTQQLTGSNLLLSLYKDLPSLNTQPLSGLYMKMVKDSVTHAYCGIYFRKGWASIFNAGDAADLNTSSQKVYMSSYTSDGVRAAVNLQPDYRKGIKVKVYANAAVDGIYMLNTEGIRNIDTLYDIFLIDHYKNDSLDMRRYGSYTFNIYKSDTSSFGGSRFELSIHPRPLPPYKLLSFTGQKVRDGIQLTWKTESEANYTGFVLQKQDDKQYIQLYSLQSNGSGTYTFTDHNPIRGNNTYRLQQSGITGNISYSSPVTITYDQAGTNESICVYPNPVKDVINLTINRSNQNANGNQLIGINGPSFPVGSVSYGIKIMTITGTVVMSNNSTDADWHQNAVSLAPGPYIIQVINNNDKSLIGKSMFVKI